MQNRQKGLFRFTVLVAFIFSSLFFISATAPVTEDHVETNYAELPSSVYTKLHLKELGLNEKAFNLSVKGWEKMKLRGEVSKNIISICDFSQSSNNKRLYIIDMLNGKLLFNTLVAHGKNTGEEFAKVFSNQPESHKSSLGFYSTKSTYFGEHGLSLKLEGREPGFNDKAEERAIVIHGASYVCENFINSCGRLGRSFGCPSVPYDMHKQIINTIKDGSCLFVYYPDAKYLASSKLLR
ncbi:MAG: murein L,D-transpeptidase catalytic domain family protein [Chitinophagales bacterium]|nr:murein L,D-transpeptidase catalytic domain family protein [Chitinophagales bacterium]